MWDDLQDVEWYALYVYYISPAVQIVVMYLILYWAFLRLERLGAGGKLRGLALALAGIVVAAIIARLAQLDALNWLLQAMIAFSAVILAVVFQPEMRRLFTRIGGYLAARSGGDTGNIINAVQAAVSYMASRRIGALIVIERNDRLDEYINTGKLDCEVTVKLLCTIFWKDTPLHDGAVILRGARIAAAGVVLPLTENFEYKNLSGTRHRAGIGISEDTDALAILVSEETGTISIADRGVLKRGIDTDDLAIILGRNFGGVSARRDRSAED